LSDLAPLNALNNPVRRRLYELVANAGRSVGREEAAASGHVSRSLAAYHLDKLVECGLLEAGFLRERGRGGPGAGRPPKLYRRSRREFVLRTPPRDYRLLAELLVQAASDDRSGAVRASLERTAFEFGRSFGEHHTTDDGNRLASALRISGYEPYEAECGKVRLCNCPFHGVARQDPELVCALNLRLVEGLIDGLDADARATLQPQEGQCCVAIAMGNDLPR
jgi:predicted ArsR family transcriptional regulator